MTDTAIQEVKLRLAAMQRLITGIVTAFDYAPRTLEHGELPAFVTPTASSQYNLTLFGEQAFLDPRLFLMQLYVREALDGAEFEGETACYPFIERVQQYFLTRKGLELDSEDAPRGIVYDTLFMGDAGIEVRDYPPRSGKQYLMIEFRILVDLVKAIDYTSG